MWLALILGAPTPCTLLAEGGASTPSTREDPSPEDAPPAEDDTPPGAMHPLGIPASRPRHRPRADTSPPPVAPPKPAPVARRDGTGHFLADGRSLRHWLRSQTC